MFGFKPLSEDENLMKLKKTADKLHETVDKLVNKKNDKNQKRT